MLMITNGKRLTAHQKEKPMLKQGSIREVLEDLQQQAYDQEGLADSSIDEAELAINNLLFEAERRGEMWQLMYLKQWAELHGISIEVSDIDHIISSLDQTPDQPLARVTLNKLKGLQDSPAQNLDTQSNKEGS
jgi:hypothetical protein